MKASQKFIIYLPILVSLLSMPFWLILTEPYVVKPSPLKLFEAIHPTYYVGLTAVAVSITLLSVKEWKPSKSSLNPYLATAILAIVYIELPPIALFQHPISDHIDHLISAFYMLREGNINMPNDPFPETVSPQLFASALIMVTSFPSSLENLHRISLFLLPLLATLYVYIFMKRLDVDERFAMIGSVLNIGLTFNVLFMFTRQTYAMPIYIMLALLVLIALKERKASFSILVIVTSITFIMSDPAHIILTIIALALFGVMWSVVHVIGLSSKTGKEHFRSPWVSASFLSTAFLFWIIYRNPLTPITGWNNYIVKMWNTFILSIKELAYPLPESTSYWGKSTALMFNDYYNSLYMINVILKAISIASPALLLAYMLIRRNLRPTVLRPNTMFLVSYFLVTGIVIVLRGYGFTYTPWASMMLSFALSVLGRNKNSNYVKLIHIFVVLVMIVSVFVAPHILNVEGQRVSTSDINLAMWLGKHGQALHVETPAAGYDLDYIAYVIGGYKFTKSWYIPYEGLTSNVIIRIANFEDIVLGRTMMMKFFEKTKAISSFPDFLSKLETNLNYNHNLMYSSISSKLYIER